MCYHVGGLDVICSRYYYCYRFGWAFFLSIFE